MVKPETESLLGAIESHLLPAIMELGYRRIELSPAEEKSPDFRRAFPFGRLRKRGPRGTQIVEIQLDRDTRTRFRLNAGVLEQVADLAERPEQRVHDLGDRFELYQGRWLPRWFGPSAWPWAGSPKPADFVRAVKKAVRLLPALEESLASGRIGPHMIRFGRS